MTIDEQIDELQQLAAQVDCVIYEILFRNAGIGIMWHDERRCQTPEFKITAKAGEDGFLFQLQQHSQSLSIRIKEGKVIYHYYPTLSECLKAEKERIEKELMEISK